MERAFQLWPDISKAGMDKRIYLKIILISFGVIFLIILAITAHSASISPNQISLSPNILKQTIDSFSAWKESREKLPKRNETVTMIAVGDISYSRGVERMVKKNKDINYPFLKVKDYFKSADLVFGNLETPITAGREILDNEMVFRSNPETATALKGAGINIVSLANNHASDFGTKGITDTLNYLHMEDIEYAGAGKNAAEAYQPLYVEEKGVKLAFLAYGDQNLVPPSYEAGSNTAGAAFMRTEKMIKAVKQAKQKTDIVIVSMHAGIEYVLTPNDFQTNFAHAAIDSGANLVIGHHPHVVQTLENYKDKYIFYSLGNFVFDQMWSRETRESLSVKIYFTKDGIKKFSFLPLIIENFSQPRPANDSEAEKILQRLKYPLAVQTAYLWDSEKKIFGKTKRSALYTGLQTGENSVSKKSEDDLDNDALIETYILEKGVLTVTENSRQIWQSMKEWWVDNFILADSTNDGNVDINLSVWKAGSFGTSKPFWIMEDDQSIKNHFFIFNIKDDVVKPAWQSSNLSDPNLEMAVSDIDADGKNDLIVIEGSYSDENKCKDTHAAVWQWNGWGFSNLWRSEKGNFCNLEIETVEGRKYLIVDAL